MPTIQERLLKTLDNLVDIMEAQFTPEGAVRVTLDILRIMNENHLAEQLEKDVRNAVQMNLQSGETVNAPVLMRNITNPVSVNFSSSSVLSVYSNTTTELRRKWIQL
ncbi:hypothetical protein G5714_000096 [Onychostoma macrolepis]|uniref:Pyrin domain-containing protein n=1 Tax=Onychostoma macrolepis TaxID=369639 RepID=A0A7J6DGD0_9TELE|nr:hypothetical protein G5714_000096 [Onychostoma macrolepis]